jgi:hypothetical protein
MATEHTRAKERVSGRGTSGGSVNDRGGESASEQRQIQSFRMRRLSIPNLYIFFRPSIFSSTFSKLPVVESFFCLDLYDPR